MTAAVESMFSVREVPWHGLGVVLSEPPTVQDGLQAAGLNWEVELRQLALFSSDPATMEQAAAIPRYRATVRSTDAKVLGIVGERYTPLQNREAFGFMDPLVSQGSVSLETAGSLWGGRVVWVLGKLTEDFEVLPGDRVKEYLLVTTAHDGTRLVRVKFTSVRVVCNNTLSAALVGSKRKGGRRGDLLSGGELALRHTKGVGQFVIDAGKLLAATQMTREVMREVYRALTRVPISAAQNEELLRELLPDNEEAKNHSRTEAARALLNECIEKSPGAEIPGVRGTGWGWLNGATYYADHFKGLTEAQRAGQEQVSEEKATSRLGSNLFGDTAKFKASAFELVTELLEGKYTALVKQARESVSSSGDLLSEAPSGLPAGTMVAP